MRRGLGRWALVASAWCAGCSPEVTEVRLDNIEFSYAIAIFLSDGGSPVRVGSVFGRHEGEVFGSTDLELKAEEDQVLLVTFTVDQLREAFEDVDLARATELSVELQRPPLKPTFVDLPPSSPAVRRAALPGAASYYVARLNGRAQTLEALDAVAGPTDPAQNGVTLLVPVEPEFCRPRGQTPLQPFAASAAPFGDALNPNPALSQTQDLIWLEDDRALVVAYAQLFLIRRGEVAWTLTSTGAYRLPADDQLPERFPYRRFQEGAAEAPAPDGRRTVWLTGGFPGGNNPQGEGRVGAHGALFKVVVGPNGFESVETVLETPGVMLWTAHVAADGAVLVGGDGGFLTLKRPGSDVFEAIEPVRVARDQPGANWVTAISSFQPASVRWVVGTQGFLHEFDEDEGRWVEWPIVQDIFTSPELLEFFGIAGRARGDDDVELWASASRGALVRRAGLTSDWARVTPDFPPRFVPCGAGGELLSLKAIVDVLVTDRYLYLAYQNCTAVVTMALDEVSNRSDPAGCVSLLTPEGEVPAFTPAEYTAFARLPGQNEVLVLRGDGRVLSTTWTSER